MIFNFFNFIPYTTFTRRTLPLFFLLLPFSPLFWPGTIEPDGEQQTYLVKGPLNNFKTNVGVEDSTFWKGGRRWISLAKREFIRKIICMLRRHERERGGGKKNVQRRQKKKKRKKERKGKIYAKDDTQRVSRGISLGLYRLTSSWCSV